MPDRIVSFGYKYGEPTSEGFDARKLFRNPHSVFHLRSLTGKHEEVRKFIEADPDFQKHYAWLKDCAALIEGTVYVGCVGGKHRSVFLAEKLAAEFKVPVEHRDLGRQQWKTQ